jgi:hypothetical protein
VELKTTYFEETGKQNTTATLRIARERAEELGIDKLVIASTRGNTAVEAVEEFEGFNVIVVSHSTGFREPDVQEFTEENRKLVEEKGGTILTTTHAFAGLSRAVRNKMGTASVGAMVANTLRIFGQGMKVVCEIALMAADSGLVRTDEQVVAIGGTGRGADTAVVLKPVHTKSFFDLRVQEILCKPHF